jgi:hypothetical protein
VTAQPRRHARPFRRIVLGIFGSAACFALPSVVAAQDPCTNEPASPEFTGCVVRLIQEAEKSAPIAQVVTVEPQHGQLVKLANALGHHARGPDLETLKKWSKDLKHDPRGNREAITILDNAIAANIDELRAIVSPTILAQRAPTLAEKKNAFSDFVQQKIAYLDSEKIKFYDGGPFEASARSYLSNALEEAYFLESEAGRADPDKLRRAARSMEEVLVRLTAAEFDYLPASQRTTWVNDYQFFNAALLFALGENARSRELLRMLARNNLNFGLGSTKLDHVYIYKLFNTPYVLSILPGTSKDGRPNIHIDDDALVKRFFNPAQLALFLCARLDEAGPQGLTRLAKDISELVLSDYFVIIASSDARDALEDLRAGIAKKIGDDEKLRQEGLQRVNNLEPKGFSDSMRIGARACGLNESERDRIYSPFAFKPQIEEISGFGKSRFHLLLGGRVNASQARAVADFLNKSVFPELRPLRNKLGLGNAAYIARMRIDG